MSKRGASSEDESDIDYSRSKKKKTQKTFDSSDDDSDSEEDWGKDSRRNAPLSSESESEKAFSSGDESMSGSESEDVDEYNENLYLDKADEEKLSKMKDLDREKVLAERAEKRDRLLEQRKLKREERSRNKETKHASSTRKKVDSTQSKVQREMDRAQKQVQEQKRKKKAAQQKMSSTPSSRRKRKEESSSESEGESSSESSSDSDRDSKSKKNRSRGDKDEPKKKWELELNHIESLRLGRERLENWVDKPFFKSTVPDSFVKVSIGMNPNKKNESVFRMVQVVGLETSREYQFNGKPCNKYLNVKYGKAVRKYAMKYISNRPFTQAEFDKWKEDMKKEKCSLPRESDVKKIRTKLVKGFNYIPTTEDIAKIVQENKKMKRYKVGNYALEIKRVRQDYHSAVGEGREEEAERLKKELEELIEQSKKKDAENAESLNVLADINRRARTINSKVMFTQANANKLKELSAKNDQEKEENEAEAQRRKSIQDGDLFKMHDFDVEFNKLDRLDIIEFKCQSNPSIALPLNLFPRRQEKISTLKEKMRLL